MAAIVSKAVFFALPKKTATATPLNSQNIADFIAGGYWLFPSTLNDQIYYQIFKDFALDPNGRYSLELGDGVILLSEKNIDLSLILPPTAAGEDANPILSYVNGSEVSSELVFIEFINTLGQVEVGFDTRASFKPFAYDLVPEELTTYALRFAFPDGIISSPSLSVPTIPSAPLIHLAADTGISNTDFITNNGSIIVSGLNPNATWQYSVNNGPWITGNGNSFVLPEGEYKEGAVKVRQINSEGNISNTSSLKPTVIDTTHPEINIEVNQTTEDNIVNIREAGRDITITGTVAGEFNEGDTVTLTVNGKEFQGAVNAEG
ncbi:Ig-like domain-containing protein, partial [Legionella londiniensis]